MNIELLNQITKKFSDDFIVEFKDANGHNYSISDNIEVKLAEKKLIFKEV